MRATVGRCVEIVKSREPALHVCVNAAKLVAIRDDERLHEIVTACDLISADGQAVVWASRALGQPLPSRVAGIDLMTALFERGKTLGWRVFFLGASADVLERALAQISERYPGLIVCGSHHGYFDTNDCDHVCEEIRGARPDVLFVAMSTPKKEYWMAQHALTLDVPLIMGVGGSLEIIAGRVRRAPQLLQRLGLEWAFRLAQEPRRLARRYAVTNTRFLLYLTQAIVGRLLRVA
jgi:N-acetylglucosaminyldiphosphoundecaprenol N-acetyl-beta-D-mannosaminyltransferase